MRTGSGGGRDGPDDRAAAQVVGVAILLGLTVVSLGALAAGVGTVIEENAASADASRVADGMAGALDPVERTGRSRETLAFTEGRLETADRDLRIYNDTRVVQKLDADALVWRSGDERVAFVAGAVVSGPPGRADLHAPPPVTASRGDGGVLVIGAPRLGADGTTVSAVGGATVPLRTNVSHERQDLGRSEFRIAVETRTPAALATHFREQGATVGRRHIDDDGVPSVVATYPGQRRAHLVVHDLNLSVGGRSPTTPTATPAGDGEADDEDGSSDGSDDGPPVDPPTPDGVPADDEAEGGDDG